MFTIEIDDDLSIELINKALAPTYLQLVQQNYDYLDQWLTWPSVCKAVEDFEEYINSVLHKYAEGEAIVCAMRYKGDVVGNVALFEIESRLKRAKIGYWLIESAQGNGVVNRSVRYLIDHAFTNLGIKKIQIHAAQGNTPSRAVAEKLGFKLEGIITRNEIIGDRIIDHAVYGLTEAD